MQFNAVVQLTWFEIKCMRVWNIVVQVYITVTIWETIKQCLVFVCLLFFSCTVLLQPCQIFIPFIQCGMQISLPFLSSCMYASGTLIPVTHHVWKFNTMEGYNTQLHDFQHFLLKRFMGIQSSVLKWKVAITGWMISTWNLEMSWEFVLYCLNGPSAFYVILKEWYSMEHYSIWCIPICCAVLYCTTVPCLSCNVEPKAFFVGGWLILYHYFILNVLPTYMYVFILFVILSYHFQGSMYTGFYYSDYSAFFY